MFGKSNWQSGCAAVMALGITAGSIAPLVIAAPAFAQSKFSDVASNYWAAQFIQELARRDIIAGFPNGSFRPEEPVTRAQFAAMIRKAFQKGPQRQAINFKDVSKDYWGYSAIQQAYITGFLSGYPDNSFAPNQNIPREQVLVSLANGLNYTPSSNFSNTLQYYNDSASISGYARSPIAAATEKRIVVNYPNVKFLKPKATATRAQVAAFIYQALVSKNQASAISSPYIVTASPSTSITGTLPKGSVIGVKYDKAKKILVTKDETAPLTLTVSQDVITNKGDVAIPAGSQIVGELKPAKGGSQFIAQKVVLTSGKEYKINASSQVITKTETVKKGAKLSTTLKNAALGATAAAAIAAITGDRAIATEEVLGGATIASLISLFFGKRSIELIVIDPNTDLQMTINQEFKI